MVDNPYLSPQSQTPAPSVRMPHSRLGMASLVSTLLSVVLEFGSFVAIGIVESHAHGADVKKTLPIKIILAFFLGGIFLNFVSIALGIAALFQGNRNKLYAVLGVAVGFALLSFMCCLGLLGVTKAGPPSGW
jgi:Na+/proline symporter